MWTTCSTNPATQCSERRTKQKVVTDFATLSKGASSGIKPRAALKQVLFSQGASDKTSEERTQLDELKQDLEAFAVPVNLKWMWKEESQGTLLEKSWTDLVKSNSMMPKKQRHQQEALWEFVHTELSYINKLKIIKDLVIVALVNLHQHGFLQEVTPELLFSNLTSILQAHQLFWQEVLYPMLQEVRLTGKPFDPLMLEAGCLQFHKRFSVYHRYCWEEENNLEFTRMQMESNPHFFTFVQWLESHPQCERMRLGDMQAKPHQRITKYPLLLKAVLTYTQEPPVQQTLRGMLSSVNSFLGSINDYMQLKDEELALFISAQRVEGYEVEGINEEIDKRVREICQFNLTLPIRGVGPGVVRKLLLEENLKVRGRKDSKLEVVALLFSDVLLLTKAQKKGERLKLFQPPLALDRMDCTELKDGYSFLLVEVGELQSAMNVYILVAGTPESRSTWISTIHQAKETLRKLREQENNRLENLRICQLEGKPDTENGADDMDEPRVTRPRMSFLEELSGVLVNSRPVNGSKDAEQYQPSEVSTKNTGLASRSSQQNDNNHWEDEEKVAETQMTNVQIGLWNRRLHFLPNPDHFTGSKAPDPSRFNTTRPHNLLLDGLPDVDYPTNEVSTLQVQHQPAMSWDGFLRPQVQRGRRDSDSQSVSQESRRTSMSSQSGDTETNLDPLRFSKTLKSPGLRKRRPVSMNPSSQTSNHYQEQTPAASNSSSNSDSDSNSSTMRNSLPPGFGSDSHRVLKLGALKPNQGMFYNAHQRASSDLQTLSESELTGLNFSHKKNKHKTQRPPIPNITVEGEHGLRGSSRGRHPSPRAEDTTTSGYDPHEHPSPLEGLLERAKERVRDKSGIRKDRHLKMSLTPTPSPPPLAEDRYTEWADVALMRPRALTVSKGWKEQLVDGDENENRSSIVFVDGVNVDWSGWCFDDEEVMDHIKPRDEGLLEGISRSLAVWHLNEHSEQEDGECSQV
ncbi:uncharacterized protein plekhg6 isoform X2 [Cololabis saira]|uniref:uncharacterized protein plekhg6 isoform X2 n=1 Tax=Cololabis saira TaxID=129043 RepID=UPI002AD1FF7C|nr:uncharacterized protein plekhg6 isoform X2 [Cololabis saira]